MIGCKINHVLSAIESLTLGRVLAEHNGRLHEESRTIQHLAAKHDLPAFLLALGNGLRACTGKQRTKRY